MLLTKLKLLNVRNHLKLDLTFSKETLFIGANGIGKSSILESIYILLSMRGFKRQPLSSLISFDEKFLRVEGIMFQQSNMSEQEIVLKYHNKKTLTIDGEAISNYNEYLYSHLVKAYTPDHLGILSVSQSDRRSFIDRSIFYTDINYINELRSYNRYIDQKNEEISKDSCDQLYINILNEKIFHLSNIIYKKRLATVDKINMGLSAYCSENFKEFSDYYLHYESNSLDDSLFSKEGYIKRSLYGSQRDKFYMYKYDKAIERYSSFGQKKIFSLIVMLTLINMIESVRGEEVICLLDDFESGLDKNNSEKLRNILSNGRQTVYSGIENERKGYENVIDISDL